MTPGTHDPADPPLQLSAGPGLSLSEALLAGSTTVVDLTLLERVYLDLGELLSGAASLPGCVRAPT